MRLVPNKVSQTNFSVSDLSVTAKLYNCQRKVSRTTLLLCSFAVLYITQQSLISSTQSNTVERKDVFPNHETIGKEVNHNIDNSNQPQLSSKTLSQISSSTQSNTVERKDVFPNHETIGKEVNHNINNSSQPQQSSKSIRSWGCSLNETPFIFVHVGKAGGGEARRTLLAAAIDYKPSRFLSGKSNPTAYYTIYTNSSSTFSIARFRSSSHHQYVPSSAYTGGRGSLEGNLKCDAETPIGQAVACREPKSKCNHDDDDDLTSCHLVYAGHNMIGSEMHWLPDGYLERWWDGTIRRGEKHNAMLPHWKDIPKFEHCMTETKLESGKSRETKKDDCRIKTESQIDYMVNKMDTTLYPSPWPSPTSIYSSLPILRVTIAREPFSWLASKYSWHSLYKKYNLLHDDIPTMTQRLPPSEGFVKYLMKEHGPGWANHFALKRIMQLCGEDCVVRYVEGKMGLKELEQRTEENLRSSFAVVGLLQEMDEFYRMVGTRVAYMSNVTENQKLLKYKGTHSATDELGVKEAYADTVFQKRLIDASPEIATLVRLHEVSVEVNRFQRKELQACPSWNIDI